MNKGMLVRPSDPDQVLTYVELTYNEDADNEVQRRRRLGKIASRPNQKKFSETLRRNYGGRCAATGCITAEVLEAAHIRTLDGSGDDNDPSNGILLRADIHALFDAHLITISEDTTQIEISDKMTDESYRFLKGKKLTRPLNGPAPSQRTLRHIGASLNKRPTSCYHSLRLHYSVRERGIHQLGYRSLHLR
jgi:HNH endonuclease